MYFNFGVVSNKCSHVAHRAVTDFDGVLGKNSVKFLLLGEVFVYKLEENSTYVRLYAHAVWGLYHIMLRCRFHSLHVGCLL